ncbi:hypothetical protein ACFC1B_26835 [Streptomyces xiamenensis]|uniref:hypothetical protein n=1 Tax=Streptomyces xiamenensis TaxID=408015 RepID=UPI0035DC90C9
MNDRVRSYARPEPAAKAAPHSLHLADPGPLATKESFLARARRTVTPPSLQDSAPLGTKVRLTDPRLAYHGALLPLETDDFTRGVRLARTMLVKNLYDSPGRSPNFAVDGPRLAGKSLLAARIGFAFQGLIDHHFPADADRHPVVYIHVPHDRSDALHWSLPFAEYFGLEHSRSPETMNHRSVDMTGPITRVMERAGTRLVIVDGIEYVRDNERQTAFDYLFQLQDALPRITFLFCGIGAQEILHHALGDHRSKAPAAGVDTLEPQGIPTLWVRPVPYTAAEPDQWCNVLDDAEKSLRLYKHQPGTPVQLAAYLHARTDGSMHALNQLCQAAQTSILQQTEAIDRELLETILTGYSDPTYNCLPALAEPATGDQDHHGSPDQAKPMEPDSHTEEPGL